MKQNRNAIAGRNVETLFEMSIGDHPYTIEKIKKAFNIEGPFLKAITSGLEGLKADVKLSFAGGKNIDVNIKAYKPKTMFNQCTRSTLDKFGIKFNIDKDYIKELKESFIRKAENTNKPLIDLRKQELWRQRLEPLAKKIIKWSISSYPAREILVLYDRTANKMQIYKMSFILSKLAYEVSYTPRGNIKLGDCFQLQRKGGDGNIKTYPKNDLRHPSNNIQVKLDIKSFLSKFNSIANYVI